jgi:hypothetical protein
VPPGATFNLGVIQGLARPGLLDPFEDLSPVSAAVTSALVQSVDEPDRSYPFLDVYFHDGEFRAKLQEITHAAALQGVLSDLVTPQFRDFLSERTQ